MAVNAIGNRPVLGSTGQQTNPTNGQVLADTGALVFSPGLYEVRVIVGASVVAIWDIERRNAANSANVGDVVTFYTVAGGSGEYILVYNVEAGERVRVTSKGGFTGTGAASITAEKMA